MSDEMTLGAELAGLTSDVLEQSAAAIDDLSLEQLHYRAGDDCNSIAFDAVARRAHSRQPDPLRLRARDARLAAAGAE